jgi:hypothetical protein
MNIPKTKIAELMQQSNDKKWQLVWGQVDACMCASQAVADAQYVPVDEGQG